MSHVSNIAQEEEEGNSNSFLKKFSDLSHSWKEITSWIYRIRMDHRYTVYTYTGYNRFGLLKSSLTLLPFKIPLLSSFVVSPSSSSICRGDCFLTKVFAEKNALHPAKRRKNISQHPAIWRKKTWVYTLLYKNIIYKTSLLITLFLLKGNFLSCFCFHELLYTSRINSIVTN